ncbi:MULTISPECIES: shikimate dehydrogenase [unclassified Enterococcus]|uniref:shikimate dehydrogenase n=1 Tax=unclassified Enterococcus TaxID=2608891 RepID=UPI0015560476|nr:MULTISPECIES: shikimate dehydrogenase [unclassified Enterococcus]MBS7577752.1 shikimate dehydrogenase [Enterococcus sp. MMGLQ5-2]MBS7584054.1 shikimate dehydrogenase [Enterococcus sp. MMGLQ5-1]NPD11915.1 shikimate dehydrogenase [Enterococcus sp. MMGLQ5-1]NPD37582.1 shikimate dehydrogenase [Enterococcus sp. MMGLQ5-2]
MEINGHTRMAAVVANPIKHSLSPFIHNSAFQALGINGVYLAFEIEADQVSEAAKTIRLLDLYGINISMPYKQKFIKEVDELTDAAQLIGAINTIINQDGKLIGHNTDGVGFMRSAYELGFTSSEKMVVIGAGGAATAIIAQAMLDDVKEIVVFTRRYEGFPEEKARLDEMSDKCGRQIILNDLADTELLNHEISSARLIVNATSVGMNHLKDLTPIPDFSIINNNHLVIDVVYNPLETLFLKQAKAQGAKVSNGLGMLLYQAAESFKCWTGQEMPTSDIKLALERKFQ